MRTLNDNLAIRAVATPGSYSSGVAQAGSYVSLVDYRRVLFVCMNGELDADMPVIVLEAQDANGTGAQTIAALTGTFTNGTDEGRVGLIEVRDDDLSDGFTHVTLRVTPGAADSFSAVAILGEGSEQPAANASANGVAFNVGE
jgi:hypothetical protein